MWLFSDVFDFIEWRVGDLWYFLDDWNAAGIDKISLGYSIFLSGRDIWPTVLSIGAEFM